MTHHLVITMLAAVGLAVCAGAQPQPDPTAATGDAKRGKALYETTLRCYSCHGFDGQTGSPRLVPVKRSEQAFIAYVRKPATIAMPSFAAVPQKDLSDIYAYVKSIPQAAPPLDSIPLLKWLADRRAKAH